MSKVIFSKNAWDDYQTWKAEDRRVVRKINALLGSIPRSPHRGTGMPEPLQEDLAGLWSRRIVREHRLVYGVEGVNILVYSCRYHFDTH